LEAEQHTIIVAGETATTPTTSPSTTPPTSTLPTPAPSSTSGEGEGITSSSDISSTTSTTGGSGSEGGRGDGGSGTGTSSSQVNSTGSGGSSSTTKTPTMTNTTTTTTTTTIATDSGSSVDGIGIGMGMGMTSGGSSSGSGSGLGGQDWASVEEQRMTIRLRRLSFSGKRRRSSSLSSGLDYMATSKREWKTQTLIFIQLIQHVLPQLHAHMNKLHLLSSVDFKQEVELWFSRLFVSFLPHHVVMQLFDNFVGSGWGVWMGAALATIAHAAPCLLLQQDEQSFIITLRREVDKRIEPSASFDAQSFLQEAFRYAEVAAEQMGTAREYVEREFGERLAKLEDPLLKVAAIPKITHPSSIITNDQFETLWQWIPSRYKGCDPGLVFTSSRDGFSLLSFYRKCRTAAPHILLIRTKEGRVFGAYCTDGWKVAPKFYGTGECFLFAIVPRLRKYPWNSANKDLFMMAEEKHITVGGGGGAGIYLDSELWHGYCEYCETFKNDPLNGEVKDFECVSVEVYGFVQSS
jgi:hypothetical protein